MPVPFALCWNAEGASFPQKTGLQYLSCRGVWYVIK